MHNLLAGLAIGHLDGDRRHMHEQLRRFLDAHGPVVHRNDLPAGVRWLDLAARSGALQRLFPSTYAETPHVELRETVLRAALRYVGPPAILSHTTGLEAHGIPAPAVPIHLTTHCDRRVRNRAGLVVHHLATFPAEPWHTAVRAGLPVAPLERCLVDSWPLLTREAGPDVARAPVILAMRDRRTTRVRLRAAAMSTPRLPGLVALLRLVELLAGGCHSELELWGHAHVFDHPSLPPGRPQLPVRFANGSVVYLDRAYETEMTDVELDGAKYLSSREQRARDERRDAALAALGWLPLRFGHDRLHAAPAECRSELHAVLECRRRQLGRGA